MSEEEDKEIINSLIGEGTPEAGGDDKAVIESLLAGGETEEQSLRQPTILERLYLNQVGKNNPPVAEKFMAERGIDPRWDDKSATEVADFLVDPIDDIAQMAGATAGGIGGGILGSVGNLPGTIAGATAGSAIGGATSNALLNLLAGRPPQEGAKRAGLEEGLGQLLLGAGKVPGVAQLAVKKPLQFFTRGAGQKSLKKLKKDWPGHKKVAEEVLGPQGKFHTSSKLEEPLLDAYNRVRSLRGRTIGEMDKVLESVPETTVDDLFGKEFLDDLASTSQGKEILSKLDELATIDGVPVKKYIDDVKRLGKQTRAQQQWEKRVTDLGSRIENLSKYFGKNKKIDALSGEIDNLKSLAKGEDSAAYGQAINTIEKKIQNLKTNMRDTSILQRDASLKGGVSNIEKYTAKNREMDSIVDQIDTLKKIAVGPNFKKYKPMIDDLRESLKLKRRELRDLRAADRGTEKIGQSKNVLKSLVEKRKIDDVGIKATQIKELEKFATAARSKLPADRLKKELDTTKKSLRQEKALDQINKAVGDLSFLRKTRPAADISESLRSQKKLSGKALYDLYLQGLNPKSIQADEYVKRKVRPLYEKVRKHLEGGIGKDRFANLDQRSKNAARLQKLFRERNKGQHLRPNVKGPVKTDIGIEPSFLREAEAAATSTTGPTPLGDLLHQADIPLRGKDLDKLPGVSLLNKGPAEKGAGYFQSPNATGTENSFTRGERGS